MNPRFHSYVGIDYSGAGHRQTRTGSLRIYKASKDRPPVAVQSPASRESRKRNWNRLEVFQWLCEFLESNPGSVVGIDHGFSFPESYFKRYRIKSWELFLADFVTHWPTDQAKVTVNDLRGNSKRTGKSSELRLTEKWTSSAKSVFQFDVQGSVAKSSHCGIPYLARLRARIPSLHFWPFDGWEVPQHRSVIAEVYPSLFRNRFQRSNRTTDEQDAWSVCCWLQRMDRRAMLGRYFEPPLTESELAVAEREGWILGVS